MIIRLKETSDALGNITLNHQDFDNGFCISIVPNAGARLEVSNQNQLNEGFKFAEEYNALYLRLIVYKDDVSLSFENLGYIKKLNTIYFNFYGKNNKLKLLPNTCLKLNSLLEMEFIAEYPVLFNQFYAISNLKKLTISYHKKSIGWIELENLFDLKVHKFQENDLTSLKKMKYLKRLNLEKGSLKSLNGIENLINLETLIINDLRYLTGLKALEKASSLENIIFRPYKKVEDWEFLLNLPKLKLIALDKAESISFFDKMPNLIFGSVANVIDGNFQPQYRIEEKYQNTGIPNSQYSKAIAPNTYLN